MSGALAGQCTELCDFLHTYCRAKPADCWKNPGMLPQLTLRTPTIFAAALCLASTAAMAANRCVWPASTILAARRQLSWPVEAGGFIDGQSVLAVFSLVSFSTAVWQAKRVRP